MLLEYLCVLIASTSLMLNLLLTLEIMINVIEEGKFNPYTKVFMENNDVVQKKLFLILLFLLISYGICTLQ